MDELENWLAARRGRPIVNLGAPIAGVAAAGELRAEFRRHLNYVRRPKDALELERMRIAERATSAGFAAVVPLLSAGRTERGVQVELEAEFFRQGADFLAFETIVASGANSGVLHFPPTTRALGDGALVLIDAGAEFRAYASDVTRTYPVSGSFTPEQAAIHELVARAGEVATARALPGTEFRDIHRTAALTIAEGLTDSACCGARARRCWRAGRCRCSFRMASATWSAWAFATPARSFPAVSRNPACPACGPTCRSRPATW